MKEGQTKIIIVALACISTLNLIPLAHAKSPEKAAILRSCARLFGVPVDPKLNLFEVNQAFVFQVKFNKRGKFEGFAVEPKYAFNETHPEWEEPNSFPYLSQAEYKDLIARLDTVKPRGKLIQPRSHIAVVTNSTAYHKETYEHALLEWYELSDGQGIRSFRLSYAKRV